MIKLNKFISASITTLVLLAGSSASAHEAKWQLVYENDGQGRPVAGSLAQLIAAVRAGEAVRVGWQHQSPSDAKRKVEHVADAKFLTIMSDDSVFAQIDGIAGQTPDFANKHFTLKEGVAWVMIASTTGKNDHMFTEAATGKVASHASDHWGVKWFVKQ
jgi:hypothetical protein